MAQFPRCSNDTSKAGSQKYIHQSRLISYAICPQKSWRNRADEKNPVLQQLQDIGGWGATSLWGVKSNGDTLKGIKLGKSITSPCVCHYCLGAFEIISVFLICVRWLWGETEIIWMNITDPDLYQNLINCFLAEGQSLHQMSEFVLKLSGVSLIDTETTVRRWRTYTQTHILYEVRTFSLLLPNYLVFRLG